MKGGKKEMNKKAQSEIITTVLIILLVIAAVVIVWQVISNTLSTTSTDINEGANCFDAAVEIASAKNTSAAVLSVTVTRQGGGPATAIPAIIYVNDAVTNTTAALANFASVTVAGVPGKVGDKVSAALNSNGAICGSKSLAFTATVA
jgi:flagellin-like protein